MNTNTKYIKEQGENILSSILNELENAERSLQGNAGDIGCSIGISYAMETAKDVVTDALQKSNFQLFRELYDKIKTTPLWIVCYDTTGNPIYKDGKPMYKDAPNTLIGRIPLYEHKYQVHKLKLVKEEDLFSALVNPLVFESEKDAQRKADELNAKEQEKIEKAQDTRKRLEELYERD